MFLNNASSYQTKVISGVPQGSVLGPLLFIIFINDLSDQLTYSKIFTFADDTKLVLPINSANDKTLLQRDLNSVLLWSINNNMKLNEDKFELLTHVIINDTPSLTLLKQLPFATEEKKQEHRST